MNDVSSYKVKIDSFTGRVSCNDIILPIWAHKRETLRGFRWSAKTQGNNMFSTYMRKPELKKALAKWISKNPSIIEEAICP